LGNFLKNQQNAANAGAGAWNDPGPLLIGWNLMTPEEEKTQFALWAVAKAPLFITADVVSMSAETLAVLQNPFLIEINQDAL